jgi:hypothetical protein
VPTFSRARKRRKHRRLHPAAGPLITAIDPDTYLCELFEEFADEVASTVVRLAGEKHDPPMGTEDLLGHFERAGVRRFAARVRRAV